MQLNRKFLEENKNIASNLTVGPLEDYPERVIQFGEGNFLRAFVDWHFNELNKKGLFKGKVVIVQPLKEGLIDLINEQNGLYTLLLRGLQNGEQVEKAEIIISVSRGINPYKNWNEVIACAENPDLRYMVSNTTEAGIAYEKCDFPGNECPVTFPAKTASFLYARYKKFEGAEDKGMVIMPCELIENNGENLKRFVIQHAKDWNLEQRFIEWIERSNYFFNTLVDRIVPGYPKDEIKEITQKNGYEDKIVVSGEIFHQWVIQGDERVNHELRFTEAGLDVIWTDDIKPYRNLKVRILNGAHTTLTIPAILTGHETVRESIKDELTGSLLKEGLFKEILPTLDFNVDKKTKFANAVIERFQNPYMKHYLSSISLNSIPKFKVRVLPSLLKYYEINGKFPDALTFSFAALIYFYIEGSRSEENSKGIKYNVNDSPETIDFFRSLGAQDISDIIVANVLKNINFWDMDLTKLKGLENKVSGYYESIRENGANEAMEELFEDKLLNKLV